MRSPLPVMVRRCSIWRMTVLICSFWMSTCQRFPDFLPEQSCAKYFVPMIFLTAYAGESDKAMGFAAGADDYLTKPFSNAELLMRVKAQLRRSQQYQAQMVQQSTSASSTALTLYDLTLDPDSQSVSKNGEVIILTHTELRFWSLFCPTTKDFFNRQHLSKCLGRQRRR